MTTEKASLESQLLGAPCAVTDTEEMFWLSLCDDYQSRMLLGDKRAGQYRFRDAIPAYKSAAIIKPNAPEPHLRLGGASLTLGDTEQAALAYAGAVSRGAGVRTVSFPLGVLSYFSARYREAYDRFENGRPCDDETTVALLYWQSLCLLRDGQAPSLVAGELKKLNVSHHKAYLTACSVFAGMTDPADAMRDPERLSDLDFAILGYGLSVYRTAQGATFEAQALAQAVLAKTTVWPCVAYLAAYFDREKR